MPIDYSRYPANWKAIVAARHRLAGGRCEWVEWINGEWVRCPRMHMEPIEGNETRKTILTLAHLGAPVSGRSECDPHDKMDVREENLLLLCQAHHLRFDLSEHMKKAAETRRRKKLQSQPALF